MRLTILLSTFNRAKDLGETLEAFASLDTDGLELGVVVVDNNSTDDTPAVVERFLERLPVQYLFEPRPGKNCALNKAIDELELGEIVVFTDDDVTPRATWLQEIRKATERYPERSVWGGRVEVKWPSDHIPDWASLPYVQTVGFASHDLGDADCEYEEGRYPFGPNFWIRRDLLDAGFRYDEAVGPRPKNRIMGSETKFLHTLALAGHHAVYIPDAVVLHRIQQRQVTAAEMRRRAFRLGRSGPHYRLCRPGLLSRSRTLWRLLRMALLGRYALAYAATSLLRATRGGFMANLKSVHGIGYNLEALRVEEKLHQDRPAP